MFALLVAAGVGAFAFLRIAANLPAFHATSRDELLVDLVAGPDGVTSGDQTR